MSLFYILEVGTLKSLPMLLQQAYLEWVNQLLYELRVSTAYEILYWWQDTPHYVLLSFKLASLELALIYKSSAYPYRQVLWMSEPYCLFNSLEHEFSVIGI